MRSILLPAMLTLNIVLVYSAPRNEAEIAQSDKTAVAVVGKAAKGDPGVLNDMPDDAYVHACIINESCGVKKVADAKKMDMENFQSIEPMKGEDEAMLDLLVPNMDIMKASLEGIEIQKSMLEAIQQELDAMNNAFDKGNQIDEDAKGEFTQNMFAMPSTKGFDFGLSNKGSDAATMRLEAAMCPKLMIKLSNSQRVAAETKMQLDNAITMNGALLMEKHKLESTLTATQLMMQKAREEAAIHARVAAEMKIQMDLLSQTLASVNQEKAITELQKAQLEDELQRTQVALAQEKANNRGLTDNLKDCTDEKDSLMVALEEQTTRAVAAEEELAQTKTTLQEVTNARIECDDNLKITVRRLKKAEEDLKTEQSTREQTEGEITNVLNELDRTNRELQITKDTLEQTQEELNSKIASLEQERVIRANVEQSLKETQEQLTSVAHALEEEQNAHANTKKELESITEELAATEASRRALEEAKQLLEDELTETKSQLTAMTDERDQLQTILSATEAALASAIEDKLKCEVTLAEKNIEIGEMTNQLKAAIEQIQAEKAAREKMLATMMMVKAASDKLQADIRKLQMENIQLAQQVMKLRSEQESAVAMASGCPPTYEKFGISCYKYVREKTQWKMAQEQCMKDSGNLVSIESRHEQVFLVDYMRRHEARYDDKYVHLGGFDYHADGVFKWLSTQMPVDMGDTFWLPSNPRGNGRRCLAFQTWDMNAFGQWADEYCWVNLPFICEIETAPFL